MDGHQHKDMGTLYGLPVSDVSGCEACDAEEDDPLIAAADRLAEAVDEVERALKSTNTSRQLRSAVLAAVLEARSYRRIREGREG